jgi:hypothetical protein
MDSQSLANIINAIVAIATLGAVVVGAIAIKDNRKQSRENWQHTQQLAQEERHNQEKPILVPVGDISHVASLPNRVEATQEIIIQNMGKGIASNIHCALYFTSGTAYSSWNNGPIASQQTFPITFDRGSDVIGLGEATTVDGTFHLYNPRDIRYCPGRLTMTYNDIFDMRYVIVFDYLIPEPGKYRWSQLVLKSGIQKDLMDLDYERVQNSRKSKPAN